MGVLFPHSISRLEDTLTSNECFFKVSTWPTQIKREFIHLPQITVINCDCSYKIKVFISASHLRFSGEKYIEEGEEVFSHLNSLGLAGRMFTGRNYSVNLILCMHALLFGNIAHGWMWLLQAKILIIAYD